MLKMMLALMKRFYKPLKKTLGGYVNAFAFAILAMSMLMGVFSIIVQGDAHPLGLAIGAALAVTFGLLARRSWRKATRNVFDISRTLGYRARSLLALGLEIRDEGTQAFVAALDREFGVNDLFGLETQSLEHNPRLRHELGVCSCSHDGQETCGY